MRSHWRPISIRQQPQFEHEPHGVSCPILCKMTHGKRSAPQQSMQRPPGHSGYTKYRHRKVANFFVTSPLNPFSSILTSSVSHSSGSASSAADIILTQYLTTDNTHIQQAYRMCSPISVKDRISDHPRSPRLSNDRWNPFAERRSGKGYQSYCLHVCRAPEQVVEAAFQAIRKAAELIDMSKHKGEHPRMGATDVCPLIPIPVSPWKRRLPGRRSWLNAWENDLVIPGIPLRGGST